MTPLLHARDLTLFRGDHCLFKGLGFALNAGESILVQGPNGSGKTSLLRALAGILDVEHGEILWRGPANGDPKRFQAMVMQRPVMLRRSVAANIDFALRLRKIPRPERRRLIADARTPSSRTLIATRRFVDRCVAS